MSVKIWWKEKKSKERDKYKESEREIKVKIVRDVKNILLKISNLLDVYFDKIDSL